MFFFLPFLTYCFVCSPSIGDISNHLEVDKSRRRERPNTSTHKAIRLTPTSNPSSSNAFASKPLEPVFIVTIVWASLSYFENMYRLRTR